MRLLLGAIVAVLLAVVPLSGNDASAQGSGSNVNNFRITSFDITYDLSKDENNRSVLKAVETITATFPNSNQNHGLERALPARYNDHSVGLDVTSVTNGQGVKQDYSISSDDGMNILRIGDEDSYVHGTQVYKISYTQRDVTRFYQDTGRDEWYWDTNGTQWKVPIDSLTITANISPNLLSNREGEPSCYQGQAGSTNACLLVPAGMGMYTLNATGLSAGENVSLAFGFAEGTFAKYEPSLFERIFGVWVVAFLLTTALAFVGFIVFTVKYYNRRNRTKELHTIVTEYIPPKGTSVLVSSQVVDTAQGVFSAQLIDFAVRHFIEIIETKPKSTWKVAEYDIKVITDPAKLQAEEQEILSDMFGSLPVVGDRLALSSLQTDTKYYSRTTDNDKKLKALIEGEYAIREKTAPASRYFKRWSIALLVVGLLTLSPSLLMLAGIVALYGYYIRPLTDKGLELRRYVLGLDKYIKAAEAERLTFLQGPDTVQKIGESVNVNNPGQMVKLYERVLPYAILFGREKEWAKRLGDFYATTNTSPSWYSGSTAFNAVLFSSALGNFSSAAAYSGGSGSSSSGGSSGGGSSGGGGGGGGGGGW